MMIYTIDLRTTEDPMMFGHLKMGGKNPEGVEINSTNKYLTRNGKPWLPVMGEFHYSRYPAEYWEEELLKMKACGIDIIATYIFWIHHEEIKGEFNWTGDRNLKQFIELCHKHQLYAFLRIGPWCHGECRNGGFPDWIAAMEETRTNHPEYLHYAKRFYREIFCQAEGLLYKDGGPVIGIQIENELVNQEAHLKTLKNMALEVGFDVPLYTVTGWGAYHTAKFPQYEMIPAFGDYADEPWEVHIQRLDVKGRYFFHHIRNSASIGSDIFKSDGSTQASDASDVSHYPFITCEIGPGVQVTHHRRPILSVEDMLALPYTKLGCGSNLIGYYVFHGGSNPKGLLSTTQESKETGYPNDYPVISYDFQAPIGEYGQIKEPYGYYKLLHLFMHDFGHELAQTISVLPSTLPLGYKDNDTLRLAARVKDGSGFLFFNNHQRNTDLPMKKDVQIELKTEHETLLVPNKPFDIDNHDLFILPFMMNLDGILLKYATCQPICKIEDKGDRTWFFFEPDGKKAEYVFDRRTISDISTYSAKTTYATDTVEVNGIIPGTGCVTKITSNNGKTIRLVTLTQKQACMLWRGEMAGKECLVLTKANILFNDEGMKIYGTEPDQFAFSIYPAIESPVNYNGEPLAKAPDGCFERYAVSVKPKEIKPVFERKAENCIGNDYFSYLNSGKDELPEWRASLPSDILDDVNDVFLEIDFLGDVAQVYLKNKLIADRFYDGTIWRIGLKRFKNTLDDTLTIKILPLGREDWIFLEKWPQLDNKELAEVTSIKAIPEYAVQTMFHEPNR